MEADTLELIMKRKLQDKNQTDCHPGPEVHAGPAEDHKQINPADILLSRTGLINYIRKRSFSKRASDSYAIKINKKSTRSD
ncbi:hypothetical protein [Dethiosulfovibrio salsuginis]|uniref:hypothetical protein n=1 Tax=Dethiosulfovibrio salsuginis TaxID=561720 RepID=UPI0011773EF4|nr:hypothetical protein [Dethiosulfovibrio salsuginis]